MLLSDLAVLDLDRATDRHSKGLVRGRNRLATGAPERRLWVPEKVNSMQTQSPWPKECVTFPRMSGKALMRFWRDSRCAVMPFKPSEFWGEYSTTDSACSSSNRFQSLALTASSILFITCRFSSTLICSHPLPEASGLWCFYSALPLRTNGRTASICSRQKTTLTLS